MAEINNKQIIGNFPNNALPSDDPDSVYGRIHRVDSVMNYGRHAELHSYPSSFMPIQFAVQTDANNNTVRSVGLKAPFPINILAADLACETCAATTGTVDIIVDPAPGGAPVSILNAPEDVKTNLTAPQRVAPEVGSDQVGFDDEIWITQISGSAAAMKGGAATLWCQKR